MARSDVQLMLDVKAGDEQSFALLLQRYRTPLVNFLYRMVRVREEAEDLAQEVFLRVYRARQDYVPSAKFTTWLFRIHESGAELGARQPLSKDGSLTGCAGNGGCGRRRRKGTRCGREESKHRAVSAGRSAQENDPARHRQVAG